MPNKKLQVTKVELDANMQPVVPKTLEKPALYTAPTLNAMLEQATGEYKTKGKRRKRNATDPLPPKLPQ